MDLPFVTLVRRKSDPDKPTVGDVRFGDLQVIVLERPHAPGPEDYAKDGKPHPCIPPGEYYVKWTENIHPEHPACYQLITGPGTPAPDRDNILIHIANIIRELLGCLAPGLKAEVVSGTYHGEPFNEFGVSSSGAALGMLHDALHRKDFRLVIKEA